MTGDEVGGPSEPAELLFAWPTCPQCDEPRRTACPICETIEMPFPLADQVLPEPLRDSRTADLADDPARPNVLMLCPICDEPFRPVFYRHCARCGHDYTDGLDLAASSVAPEEWNDRMLLVASLLALLFVTVVAYFGFVVE